jgi:glycine cleavage system aminomethyltransferase T
VFSACFNTQCAHGVSLLCRLSCKHTRVTRSVNPAVLFVTTDVTGGYTQLNIQGPKSRELLQALTDTDMGNEAFPFRACREIAIGLARVNVARITYVGELG